MRECRPTENETRPRRRNGTCQPPKKSVVINPATIMASTKSPSMNMACLAPEYSVK